MYVILQKNTFQHENAWTLPNSDLKPPEYVLCNVSEVDLDPSRLVRGGSWAYEVAGIAKDRQTEIF